MRTTFCVEIRPNICDASNDAIAVFRFLVDCVRSAHHAPFSISNADNAEADDDDEIGFHMNA